MAGAVFLPGSAAFLPGTAIISALRRSTGAGQPLSPRANAGPRPGSLEAPSEAESWCQKSRIFLRTLEEKLIPGCQWESLGLQNNNSTAGAFPGAWGPRGHGEACGMHPLTRGWPGGDPDATVAWTSLRCCCRCPPQAQARRFFWGMEGGFRGTWLRWAAVHSAECSCSFTWVLAGLPKNPLPRGVWYTARCQWQRREKREQEATGTGQHMAGAQCLRDPPACSRSAAPRPCWPLGTRWWLCPPRVRVPNGWVLSPGGGPCGQGALLGTAPIWL